MIPLEQQVTISEKLNREALQMLQDNTEELKRLRYKSKSEATKELEEKNLLVRIQL